MSNKKETFLQGVLFLLISQVIVKILGMIYSLYLTNKHGFGDNGNAICMAAYQIYALFLGICSIGIPSAISRMIAENIGIGNLRMCKKILNISLFVFTAISLFFCSLIYFGANFIAVRLLSIKECEGILKILAPSIVFSTIEAVYRGYFNGMGQIKTSAKIQTCEQLIKTILTISIVEYISKLTNFNTNLMARGSMLAATLAALISFLYSIKEFLKIKVKNTLLHYNVYTENKTVNKILKEIFTVAIPISLTSVLIILESNIDSITIVRLLKNQIGETLAQEKYGIISSKVNLLVSLPMALNGAIAVALIPEISRARIISNNKILSKSINFSLLMTLFISVPIMLLFTIFSYEIIRFLYPNADNGGDLLRLGSLTIIFTSLTQTISGILQGMGNSKEHLKAISIIVVLKTILNFIFIPIPGILEKGAIISSLICDFIVFLIMYKKLKDIIKLKISLFSNLSKILMIGLLSILFIKIVFVNINIKFYFKFVIEIFMIGLLYCFFVFKCKILSVDILLKQLNINKK